ncbi:hypothetical protein BOTBODRAFT_34820 [Botryobasidium botryosum FD-172 SS1]|uniref:Acyl-CoA dehydrogenase/oxidase C-terminal domain-containing protein n=1 Tax=Botryobasidium botryosum (strain FD-172 SS1) TaxID=930990 RepID=A0A067M863_BOTB1|nr:hypothetical protein BOTBODRAFT_34820 [Botryobasidium botryosum FD-172 SS1]
MRVEQGFQVVPYPMLHPYKDDLVLPSLLRRILPDNLRSDIEADLIRWGEDIRGPIRSLLPLTKPPSLTQYNQWGQRIDRLEISEGWHTLKRTAAKEGLVNIFYSREKYGEWARIYGFAKTLMWVGDSNVAGCPISMTDGTARVLELTGTEQMKRDIFSRLISTDPKQAFTSGQWMTERTGGSDVSRTETTAVPAPGIVQTAVTGTEYRLNGFKWFTSAADGHVSLALARTGEVSGGSRALSLFLVPMRLPLDVFPSLTDPSYDPAQPKLNGLELHRLKNKVGTHIVPTAELSLSSTRALLLGKEGQGVKSIVPVLNITRVHCSIHALGALARAYHIAQAFASVRRVGSGAEGTLLRDIDMHTYTLAEVSVLYRALAHLVFGVVRLLGRDEAGTATQNERLRLRMMTPVVKAFTSSRAVGGMEECMIALGGQGYMEENDIGRLVRDALVEEIWEGTPNVLALDLVRAVRDPSVLEAFVQWGNSILSSVSSKLSERIKSPLDPLSSTLLSLPGIFKHIASAQPLSPSPVVARPVIQLMGHISAALYLLEHAIWACANPKTEEWEVDVEVFVRWVERRGDLMKAKREVERVLNEGAGVRAIEKGIVYGKASLGLAKL